MAKKDKILIEQMFSTQPFILLPSDQVSWDTELHKCDYFLKQSVFLKCENSAAKKKCYALKGIFINTFTLN